MILNPSLECLLLEPTDTQRLVIAHVFVLMLPVPTPLPPLPSPPTPLPSPPPSPNGANIVSPLVYAFAGSEWGAAGQAGAQHGICSRQVWPRHLPRKHTSASSGPGREAAVWPRQRLGRQGLLL